MAKLQSVGRVLIGRLSQPLMAFILLSFLTRMLSKPEMGKYSLLISLFSGLAVIFSFGVEQSMPYFLPKKKDKPTIFKNAAKILFTLFIIMSITVLILRGEFYRIYELEFKDILLLIGGAFGILLYRFTQYSLQGTKKFDKFMWNSILYRAGSFLAIILIVLGLNYSGAVMGEIFGYTLAGLISVYWLRKMLRTQEISDYKAEIVKYSFLIYLTAISLFFITTFMKWYVGVINVSWVAEIDVGTRLGSLTALLPAAIMTVFLPDFSGSEKRKQLFHNAMRWALFVGLFSLLFLLPNTGFFVELAFSSKYVNIIPTTMLYLTAFLLTGINSLIIAYFLADRKQKYNVLVIGFQAITIIPLLFYLVPLQGILGTGIALIIINIIGFLMNLALLSKIKVRFPYKEMGKCVLASIIALLFITINPFTQALQKTLFNIASMGIVYAVVILMSKAITIEDLKSLRSQLKHKTT